MLKAIHLETVYSPKPKGDWRHFRCEPGGPLPEFVVVSAADTIDHGPETYIFAADAEGKVTNFSELDGSFIGSMDHVAALRGAGYEAFGVAP